jgi:hypothetical protein
VPQLPSIILSKKNNKFTTPHALDPHPGIYEYACCCGTHLSVTDFVAQSALIVITNRADPRSSGIAFLFPAYQFLYLQSAHFIKNFQSAHFIKKFILQNLLDHSDLQSCASVWPPIAFVPDVCDLSYRCLVWCRFCWAYGKVHLHFHFTSPTASFSWLSKAS